ncbi:hypothetical protein K7432_006196 [Basidiobolus ranarum]|uniref:Myb-like DNA-binding domain containing protein n=1 Tax=Basidiobolus ranarum TaxID=34480 RepID=A0ABR2WVB9_9FUNG
MLASPTQKHENSQAQPPPLLPTPRKVSGYVAIQPKIRRGVSLDLSFSDPEDSPSPRATKKKVRWTEAEDKQLIAGIKNYGLRWSMISKTMSGRSSHQCLKRWSLLVRKLGSAEMLGNDEAPHSLTPGLVTPTSTRTNKRALLSPDGNTTPTARRRLFTKPNVTPQTQRVERVLTKRLGESIAPVSPTSYKSAMELERLLFQNGGLEIKDDSDNDELSVSLPLCLRNIPKSVERNLIPISEIKSEPYLPELCDLPSTPPSSDEHLPIATNLLTAHSVPNTPNAKCTITNTYTPNVYSQILNSANEPLYLAVIQDLMDDFSVLTSRVNKLATKVVMSIMGQQEVWDTQDITSEPSSPRIAHVDSVDVDMNELDQILNQIAPVEVDSSLLSQEDTYIEELLRDEQGMELVLGEYLSPATKTSLDYCQFLDQLHDLKPSISYLQSEDDSESTDQEFALRTRNIKREKMEEFREDRGATISKHEVEELYKEEVDELEQNRIAESTIPSGEDYSIFSPQQLHLLRKQQQQNFQILIQAFVLERELRGNDSEFGKHWQDKIHELKDLQSEARQTSPPEYVSFFEVVGLDYTDLLFEASFPEEYRSKEFETAIRKPKSKRIKIDTKNGLPAWENRVQDPISLPISVKSALDEFYPLLDLDLIPQIVPALPRVRVTFHSSEDSLLLIGLKSFGDDWNTIRSHVLPSKTPSQLENRFNNLKSRRYPDNPVKEYYLQQIKPLTVEEEEILRNSVKIYGKRFKFISEKFLIHRPAFVLKRAWQLLVPKNKKGFNNEEAEFKKEEDEDDFLTSTLDYSATL